MKALLTRNEIAQVFELLAKQWPEPRCELIHSSPFQLLLAVILSAQTTDKSVNKALATIYEKNPSFSAADLIVMGEKNFYEKIKSIGLAKGKAKHALAMAEMLVNTYNNTVPMEFEKLVLIPGVGRKTANVVLNVIYSLPTIGIDTHIARVSKRLGLVESGSTLFQTETRLLQIIPKKFLIIAHYLLVFLGRYICKARNPQCEICPLNKICKKNF